MYKEVIIQYSGKEIKGHMHLCEKAKAWIVFAHGSGSSRKSKRNNWVALELNKHGFSTLLFDLLTPEEDATYSNRFDIPLLADRLKVATDWLIQAAEYDGERIGYFGASTGAAAALMAAAPVDITSPLYAIVGRGGRPDLADQNFLNAVTLPTLLIVGSHDEEVIQLNEWASTQLVSSKLVLVPGATHLFEEPGALEEVTRLTSDWFSMQLDLLEMQNKMREKDHARHQQQ